MSFRMIRTPAGRTPQVPSASSLCIEPNETRLMTAELRCVWADTLLKIKLLHWHRWLKEPLTSTESFQCTKGSLDYLYVVNNTKNMLLLRTDHWRFFGEPEMGLLWHHCEKNPLEPLFLGALNPHKRFFRLLKCSSNSFRKFYFSVCKCLLFRPADGVKKPWDRANSAERSSLVSRWAQKHLLERETHKHFTTSEMFPSAPQGSTRGKHRRRRRLRLWQNETGKDDPSIRRS